MKEKYYHPDGFLVGVERAAASLSVDNSYYGTETRIRGLAELIEGLAQYLQQHEGLHKTAELHDSQSWEPLTRMNRGENTNG